MVGLQLAGVGLPSQILTVDERNGFISRPGGNVLSVGIKSVGWLSGQALGYRLAVRLQVVNLFGYARLGGYYLVLTCDHGNLYSIGVGLHRHSLLHVVVGLLLCVKALNLVFR